jgi:hypothetical protein
VRKDLLFKSNTSHILEGCKDNFSKNGILARDIVKVTFKVEDLGQ